MSQNRTGTSERGATAVEYGLIIALIMVTVIVAALLFSNETSALYDCTGQSITTRVPAC